MSQKPPGYWLKYNLKKNIKSPRAPTANSVVPSGKGVSTYYSILVVKLGEDEATRIYKEFRRRTLNGQ